MNSGQRITKCWVCQKEYSGGRHPIKINGSGGNYFSCFTAKLGASYVWYCADGVGALTTN